MSRTVNEKSPLYMTLTFTDENEDPLIPSTVEWRLDDTEQGTEVVAWTAVPSPASTMNMVVPAEHNLIVDEDKIREARMYGIRVNFGLQSEAHAQYKYHVLNMRGALGT